MIDTPSKRKSCIGLALLFLRTGIIPSGVTLDASDRLHTDGLYNGIAAGAPVVNNIAEETYLIDLYHDQDRNLTIYHTTNNQVDRYIDQERSFTLER